MRVNFKIGILQRHKKFRIIFKGSIVNKTVVIYTSPSQKKLETFFTHILLKIKVTQKISYRLSKEAPTNVLFAQQKDFVMS